MAHHKDLTGVDLHEPKGVATATSGQAYLADGAGSGAWTTPKVSYVTLEAVIVDISTAGDFYVVAPVAGVISRIDGVLGAAISGANSAVTFAIGGVAIDSSAMSVLQSGSAAGDQYSSTPSGHNTVVAGSLIKVSTDGASTGTAPFTVTLLVNVS